MKSKEIKSIDTILIAVGGQGERITVNLKKRGINTSKIFLRLNNKPFLSHLLDMSLALKFRRIFLLSSYYESELRAFLKENYPTIEQIIPIYGGKLGRKWGVPWLLYSIRQELQKTFVYSDGNILYNKNILKKIKSIGILKSALANIVISHEDLAPTHSQIIVHRGQVQSINTRLPRDEIKTTGLKGKQYYSLGLMTLCEPVFSFVSNFAYKKDLDFVIRDIFESDKNMVKVTIYNGSWAAIHTIRDLDKLEIKD